ncbi:hypothetical protein BKA69DRAFT_252998 [Paraphysoderma sedebokerense]|nr:hypothetical protein BKA69DRAFT_252998 [Paraphysoderma sedebokerense]
MLTEHSDIKLFGVPKEFDIFFRYFTLPVMVGLIFAYKTPEVQGNNQIDKLFPRERVIEQALPYLEDNQQLGTFTVSLYSELLNEIAGPNMFILSAHFFHRLRSQGYEDCGHRKILIKNNINIFDLSLCLIPTYWQNHFGLGLIFGKYKKYAYIDSLGLTMGFEDTILDELLPNEAERLGLQFQRNDWVDVKFDLPKQIGGIDCGAFVMGRMKRIVTGCDIKTVTQANIASIRRELKGDIQAFAIQNYKEGPQDPVIQLLKLSCTPPLEATIQNKKRKI